MHQAKTMLFEVLATGSGRKQQHHPYVKVFRSLLQGFLKVLKFHLFVVHLEYKIC